MKIVVTGGAGFIGSAVCRHLIRETDAHVVNVDKLTYAANLRSLDPIATNPRYAFVRADVCDRAAMDAVFAEHAPDAVMHLAAESHVDRSINGSDAFVRTNVLGTHCLLEAARADWMRLPASRAERFRFLHVSTDEVYGSLGPEGSFSETTAYDPSSPYSASKAAADHLASAWFRTYGFPVVISNCSNNYGPYQFPEKLIPLMILNALEGRPLPIYGDGGNVRDWLHVDDHGAGILLTLERGRPGEKYNIGGGNERTNLQIIERLCDTLEALRPAASNAALKGRRYSDLKTFVADRPGHDRRYAIDATKIREELGWQPSYDFESGLNATVAWYLEHPDWAAGVQAGRYDRQRLGIA